MQTRKGHLFLLLISLLIANILITFINTKFESAIGYNPKIGGIYTLISVNFLILLILLTSLYTKYYITNHYFILTMVWFEFICLIGASYMSCILLENYKPWTLILSNSMVILIISFAFIYMLRTMYKTSFPL